MADEQNSTVDGGTTVTTEQNQPPQQQPQQQPQQSHTDRGPGPGQQLLDAINALPERLVHAIQEATPKQAATRTTTASTKDTSAASTKDTSATDNPGPGGTKLTRQQRFVKWYGGQ